MEKKDKEKLIEIQQLKDRYEQMSLLHTQKMVEIREKNMAFDELLSRILSKGDGLSFIQEAFYELKEMKIANKELGADEE